MLAQTISHSWPWGNLSKPRNERELKSLFSEGSRKEVTTGKLGGYDKALLSKKGETCPHL